MLQTFFAGNFLKYCIVGLIGLIADTSIYYVLCKTGNVPYLVANLIGAHAGLITNFYLNSRFTFRLTDKKKARFFSYYTIAVAGIVLSSFLLKLFIEGMEINILGAKLISLLLITVLQFSLNKHLTFNKQYL